MDRFFNILREELAKTLAGPGVTWDKRGIMAAFDRSFAMAIAKYAKELKIDLT